MRHKLKIKKESCISSCELHQGGEMRIVPFIQPINESLSGEIVGGEILMRLYDGCNYISPAKVISEIERKSTMNDITVAMMNEVQNLFSGFFFNVAREFYLSFNIYAPQLCDVSLNNAIRQLSRALSPKAGIVLEIVERSPRIIDENLAAVMNSLRSDGVRFAIDDFGHPSSSVAYLDYAGFSFIKLDRSITQVYREELIQHDLINTIVSVSQCLDLHLIAEGIELEVQKNLLNDCGVVDMQGYLFYPPMPLGQFLSLYKKLYF